jgi:hypothetical protein
MQAKYPTISSYSPMGKQSSIVFYVSASTSIQIAMPIAM